MMSLLNPGRKHIPASTLTLQATPQALGLETKEAACFVVPCPTASPASDCRCCVRHPRMLDSAVVFHVGRGSASVKEWGSGGVGE
eukprot:2001819-Rhodomonas_salina.2